MRSRPRARIWLAAACTALAALLALWPAGSPAHAGTALPSTLPAEPPLVDSWPTSSQPTVERHPYIGPLTELRALTDSNFRVETQGARSQFDLEILVDHSRITLATCHDTAVDPSGNVVIAMEVAANGAFDARLRSADTGLEPVGRCMARVIRGFRLLPESAGTPPRHATLTVELLAPPR